MTWNAFHHRGEVLRAVINHADSTRDGNRPMTLPMDLPGVTETFGDELALIAALHLRWHTRLAGHIERALMDQPMDLEASVIEAWQGAADELPGVRAILDHYLAEPSTPEMEAALAKATANDQSLLAAMAGRASGRDAAAVAVGRRIEEAARTAERPSVTTTDEPARTGSFLDRIRAVIAA